jgi:hypothetical protein
MVGSYRLSDERQGGHEGHGRKAGLLAGGDSLPCSAVPLPRASPLIIPTKCPSFMQMRSIVAREGARGLYAGYGAFLLRDLPFDAIEFVAYEQASTACLRQAVRGRDRPTSSEESSRLCPISIYSSADLYCPSSVAPHPDLPPPSVLQIKRNYALWAGRDLHPGETSIAGAIAGGFTGERSCGPTALAPIK